MKKLFTIACTLVLGAAMSFAQAGTTQTPPAGDSGKTGASAPTTKKHHHAKKGAKKSKKSTDTTTTQPPK
jgi:hypothetical protein